MQAVPVTSRSQQPRRRAASRAPIRVGSHGLQRVPRFDLSFPERVHCFPLRSTHTSARFSRQARDAGAGAINSFSLTMRCSARYSASISSSRAAASAISNVLCLRGVAYAAGPTAGAIAMSSPRGWRLRLRAGAVRAVACAGYRPRGAYDHSLPCAADARLTLPAPEQCFRRPSSERSEAKTTRQAAENDSPLLSMRKHFSFLVF